MANLSPQKINCAWICNRFLSVRKNILTWVYIIFRMGGVKINGRINLNIITIMRNTKLISFNQHFVFLGPGHVILPRGIRFAAFIFPRTCDGHIPVHHTISVRMVIVGVVEPPRGTYVSSIRCACAFLSLPSTVFTVSTSPRRIFITWVQRAVMSATVADTDRVKFSLANSATNLMFVIVRA